jgi:hypothetical protein
MAQPHLTSTIESVVSCDLSRGQLGNPSEPVCITPHVKPGTGMNLPPIVESDSVLDKQTH